MSDMRKAVTAARLVCVTPPDPGQEARIRAFLASKYAEPVSLEIAVDPSLRSGFRLSVGSDVYDWSADGRLEQLREQVERVAGAARGEDNLIPLLRAGISEFRLLAERSEVGTVLSVGDGIAVVEGL